MAVAGLCDDGWRVVIALLPAPAVLALRRTCARLLGLCAARGDTLAGVPRAPWGVVYHVTGNARFRPYGPSSAHQWLPILSATVTVTTDPLNPARCTVDPPDPSLPVPALFRAVRSFFECRRAATRRPDTSIDLWGYGGYGSECSVVLYHGDEAAQCDDVRDLPPLVAECAPTPFAQEEVLREARAQYPVGCHFLWH